MDVDPQGMGGGLNGTPNKSKQMESILHRLTFQMQVMELVVVDLLKHARKTGGAADLVGVARALFNEQGVGDLQYRSAVTKTLAKFQEIADESVAEEEGGGGQQRGDEESLGGADPGGEEDHPSPDGG